jgi:hypothetical protein
MKKTTSDEMAIALGVCVKRWQRWVAAELQGIAIARHNNHERLASSNTLNDTCPDHRQKTPQSP